MCECSQLLLSSLLFSVTVYARNSTDAIQSGTLAIVFTYEAPRRVSGSTSLREAPATLLHGRTAAGGGEWRGLSHYQQLGAGWHPDDGRGGDLPGLLPPLLPTKGQSGG